MTDTPLSDDVVERVAEAIDPNEHLATVLRYQRARAVLQTPRLQSLLSERDKLELRVRELEAGNIRFGQWQRVDFGSTDNG